MVADAARKRRPARPPGAPGIAACRLARGRIIWGQAAWPANSGQARRSAPRAARNLMSRTRQARRSADSAALLRPLAAKLQPPFAVILGSPKEAADLVAALPPAQVVCWQLDLFQAARLKDELSRRQAIAEVVTLPDLWD